MPYIAWPILLANISTPMLALVDPAVIGNLRDPVLIGAIAAEALMFNFLLRGFGFLRTGMIRLAAQAPGIPLKPG